MSFRLEKINGLLRREIGNIILRDLEFGSDVLITISEVDTTSNLLDSKVKITILPESKEELVFKEINRNLPEIQTRLFRKLRIGRVPKIRFEIDKGAKNEQRVDELLGKEPIK